MAENESPSTLIQDFLNLFQNMISYCNLNWVPSICQVMPSFPDWILFIEFISKTSFAYYDRMIHILCESLAVQSCTTHQSCPLSLKVEALLEKIQKNLKSSSKDYEVITAKLHDMQTKVRLNSVTYFFKISVEITYQKTSNIHDPIIFSSEIHELPWIYS